MFYLGVTLEKELFRIAILKKDKGKLLVESTHSFAYGPENVKLFYNLAPFHTKQPINICSGIAAQDLFIRKLHLPLVSKHKILKTLPFQLESLIPFSEESPLVCTQIRSFSKQMTSVTICATSESKVKDLLSQLNILDITPDRVSCMPAALERFTSWLFPTEKKILCIDIREGVVVGVLIENKEIQVAQTLFPEGELLTLEKLALFLKQKDLLDEETPWLLTGDLQEVATLKRLFTGKQLLLPNSSLGDYALAIGLALESALEDGFSIQFCQQHLMLKSAILRRKKYILTYTACCLGAALMMGICSLTLLNKKEKLLASTLKTYLPSIQENATIEDMREGLMCWENTLKGKKNTFALIPNVPKVSDLLSYLSAHPNLTTEEGEKKEEVEIESIHYSLIKYPKIGDPSCPYVAQVKLELTSSTPRLARDFHEALLKGDYLVNSKKEIKWHSQGKNYSTSFELNKGGTP